ncbi:MAG: DNA polymerase IV [Rhodobacteraceae bacterium]|nr:DNA polymerase IV [Paracoccaceae bacterium]
MPVLCRDCENLFEAGRRCPSCQSPRVTQHEELTSLAIAHMDCDAFYAAIEKRDRPEIRDQPVIIGGGRRGVVSTACYIARMYGVHSAMPMFRALKLCPDAVVIKPRMQAYSEASKQIRAFMTELTPAIEPLSLDEAFLDLSGTERSHGAPPAVLLARLVNRMEREIGLTGSIGLSHNKFLAKLASDLNKPRGFSIIGKAETAAFLAKKPVGLIWGVGAVQQKRLARSGIRTFADLRRRGRERLESEFGAEGIRLWHLAQGEDDRRVKPSRPMRSMSSETTFHKDISDREVLNGYIWRLSEKVSARSKRKELAGRVVTLKLKRHDFKLVTRRRTLSEPTQAAEHIYTIANRLFEAETHPGPYRLIGVGLSDLVGFTEPVIPSGSLDPESAKSIRAEQAADSIRQRFGPDAIRKGRSLR